MPTKTVTDASFQSDVLEFGNPGAGRFLGGVVRPVQDDRPRARGNQRRARRQGDHRQDGHHGKPRQSRARSAFSRSRSWCCSRTASRWPRSSAPRRRASSRAGSKASSAELSRAGAATLSRSASLPQRRRCRADQARPVPFVHPVRRAVRPRDLAACLVERQRARGVVPRQRALEDRHVVGRRAPAADTARRRSRECRPAGNAAAICAAQRSRVALVHEDQRDRRDRHVLAGRRGRRSSRHRRKRPCPCAPCTAGRSGNRRSTRCALRRPRPARAGCRTAACRWRSCASRRSDRRSSTSPAQPVHAPSGRRAQPSSPTTGRPGMIFASPSASISSASVSATVTSRCRLVLRSGVRRALVVRQDRPLGDLAQQRLSTAAVEGRDVAHER